MVLQNLQVRLAQRLKIHLFWMTDDMTTAGEPAVIAEDSNAAQSPTTVELKGSANGRVCGKGWKLTKTATRRSHLPSGVKVGWEERMEKTKKEKAIKKLQHELKEEKQAEIARRREITAARKKAALERQQFEEMKAKMNAKKAARLKRKAGRSKKVHG